MNKNTELARPTIGWEFSEFGEVDFCDKRLATRLIKIAGSFANAPESSINMACDSWAEAKAAYRFFQNDSVCETKILAKHTGKTIERISEYQTVLAIQDTCYISYKNHKKTKVFRCYSCQNKI